MGWCSGTGIFDDVCKFILTNFELTDSMKHRLIKELWIALENHDWDCQDDSRYIDHPIVNKVYLELHPDYFEDEEDNVTISEEYSLWKEIKILQDRITELLFKLIVQEKQKKVNELDQ